MGGRKVGKREPPNLICQHLATQPVVQHVATTSYASTAAGSVEPPDSRFGFGAANRRLGVCAKRSWLSDPCNEFAGEEWAATVRSMTWYTATVSFDYARTSRDIPYADERLDWMVLKGFA